MLRQLFVFVVLSLSISGTGLMAANDPLTVKNVSLTQNKDIYTLDIELYNDIEFMPRIHILPNGVKIFMSFDKPISLPKIWKKNEGIVKGYFFEKFGPSSLMFVMALKVKVKFLKKAYSKNYIRITFRLPKKHTVVVDAGHGGKDPGTRSYFDEYTEKNITLVTAIELRNALLRTDRYNVILTRDSDTFIPLEQRLQNINAYKGDFLISLHTDYNYDKNLRGMSVYTLPRANLPAANANYNLNIAKSQKFANCLTGYVPQFFKIKTNACRSSDLKILKNNMPSVLVELGCISNETDSKLLLSKMFREKIVNAIVRALDQYFGRNEK